MKKFIYLNIFVLLFSINLFAKIDNAEAQKIAESFLDNFIANKSEAMFEQFSEAVKKQLPLEQTVTILPQIIGVYGEFKNRGEVLVSEYKGLVLCSSILTFQKGNLEARISVDNDGKVSGFFMTPKQDEDEYIIPSYADTTKFKQIKLSFGEEPFILDGILTLPLSKEPTPVVLLVHGSGPHDLDETIGPNKPFRDIAYGLATNGIATFRYNKRTKQHPELMMENFEDSDVYDEVINDAVIAINMLHANAELYHLNPSKIFALGHSLGGTLVPRIAKKSGYLDGVISLAGMSRRIENVLLEQYEYLFSIDGEISNDERMQIEELQRQIRIMLSPNLNKDVPSDSLPLSMPAKYWMTFKLIDPAKEMSELNLKILIMQGGRDYQVTMDDFNIWKNALKNNNKAQFKLYDNLNHLFQPGEGKSKPEEYYRASHIDERVIKDLIEWIKKI